jgi:hypothetical protein
MKALAVVAALSAVGTTAAAAGDALLTGPYQCVQHCRGTGTAFIAQNAWQLSLVNEAGLPARGWIDEPGRIWVPSWNEGASYSGNGFIIFEDGTAWQRVIPAPLPTPAPLPYIPDRG